MGNVVIQRYITGPVGAYGFHHISSPETGDYLSNLQGVNIAGINGVGAFIHNQEGTVQEYEEASNTSHTLDSGYYNYTSQSNQMSSGLGLAVNMLTGSTISFTGPPTTGNLTYSITKLGPNPTTAGWNLIGNPYPEPLSWTSLKSANTGVMNATCYIWKPTNSSTGSWAAYNGGAGVGSATDVLALGQGFMILKTNVGATNLSFTNSMRYPALNPPYYKTNVVPDEIRLILTEGEDTAEILSYTQAGTSLAYDEEMDAPLPPFFGGTNSNAFAFSLQNQKYLIMYLMASTRILSCH